MNSSIRLKGTTLSIVMGITLLLVHFTAFAAPDGNTSLGIGALPGNTRGSFNTAVGYQALNLNSTGDGNTANGVFALQDNTTGTDNVAMGSFALSANGAGNFNTAIGVQALQFSSGGSNNIAIGYQAGHDNHGAGTAHHNIYIGHAGVSGESSTIRIGDSNQARTFISGVSGVTVSGAGVVVNASGQLGVAASSSRFKDEIKPMDKGSEAILALKPVTFRYKKEIDPECTPQFGLVAEEVGKVNPNLVTRDRDGRPFSVRYDAVNAMLLNEFLKEHRKVEEQRATIAGLKSIVTQQQKGMEILAAQLKDQAAQIQKVSAQIEMSRPVPQMASNDR